MLGGILNHVNKAVIHCGYTDLRKSIDGLMNIVKEDYGEEIPVGTLFLFCGKSAKTMKALLREEDGYLLLVKRMNRTKLRWPRSSCEARELTIAQVEHLMVGLTIK